MARPTLTADQRTAIESAAASQTAKAANLLLAQASQDAAIAAAEEVDNAFKALFDWYNDSIIGKYDAEKKALHGTYVAAPILEADIIGVAANPSTGRLIPTYPAYDILRITQFDGGGTTTTTVNETQAIADQVLVEGYLVSGYTPQPTLSAFAAVDELFTSASVIMKVVDSTDTSVFAIGDVFTVADGTTSALVRVTSVTITQPAPITKWTLGIEFIVTPAGNINPATLLLLFNGFTNAERTAKVPTDTKYQNIMDYLIAQMQAKVNLRISRLNEQLAAIAANQDPDAVSALATATTNANTSKSFLTAYLVTTLITDVALGTLSTERGVRSPQVSARVTAIGTAYTGQTENYYNARYAVANNRGNLQRGTLREMSNAENAKSVLEAMGASLGDSTAALNSLL